MNPPDRRSRATLQTLIPRYPGRRADDVHAIKAWHPAARVAVVVMLCMLSGTIIWMDAILKANSLPKLQVFVSPVKLGFVAPPFIVG